MLRTLLASATVSVMTILLAPLAALGHVICPPAVERRLSQWCMHTWARAAIIASGVKIIVHGSEHIAPERGTVYVSNHVSWMDVFTLASTLPNYTFVAKAELRRIPIFGWGAEACGVVFLERENRMSAFEAYRNVAAKVAKGLSVVVCPEGTRGESYALRPFKKGPFVLAIAAKAPVVPIAVYGTREVMPKGTPRVKSGVVHIHFLAPVETTGYDYEHRHDLMRMVWQRIADILRDEHGVGSGAEAIASADVEGAA